MSAITLNDEPATSATISNFFMGVPKREKYNLDTISNNIVSMRHFGQNNVIMFNLEHNKEMKRQLYFLKPDNRKQAQKKRPNREMASRSLA
ncbi:protein of unknown function [Vibrio tapetis subsp. tapetis]|uniref:Uncharacterized protein n=1 Tax=Vibrio tapetis subsp. tapetis TaxID=1671868 RepID=A0A2N8ZA45_9VIBR|nr:protein of unknown function [Vibrio tapetis subsp. tapetis]